MHRKEFSADWLEQTRKSYFHPSFLSTLYDFLGLKDGMKILDVGCGTGYYCRLIAPKIKGKIIGVDIDQKLLDAAKKLTKEKNVSYRQQNAYSLEFDDDSFNLVWCQTLLCNLNKPEQALKEMIRVSKNKVIALEPCNSSQIKYFGDDSEIKSYYNLVTKVKKKLEKGIGGDFDIGYKMPYLFYKNGLKNIDVLSYCIIDIYKGDKIKDDQFLKEAEKLVPEQITREEYQRLKTFSSEAPLGSLIATPVFIVKGDKY